MAMSHHELLRLGGTPLLTVYSASDFDGYTVAGRLSEGELVVLLEGETLGRIRGRRILSPRLGVCWVTEESLVYLWEALS